MSLEKEYTRVNLRILTTSFYTKVLKDEIVGPIFISKLGDDLMGPIWGPHLDLITNFWASITMSDPIYQGSPFAPHMQLADLSRAAFERWLKLFFETLDTIYEPAIADELKQRSTLIAGNFMRNLRL